MSDLREKVRKAVLDVSPTNELYEYEIDAAIATVLRDMEEWAKSGDMPHMVYDIDEYASENGIDLSQGGGK